VTVTDRWELAPALDRQTTDPRTTVRWLAAGDVTVGPGQAEIVALEGAGTVVLTWEPAVPCAITVRDLDDPMLSDVWTDHLTRLDLDVCALGPAGTLVVRIEGYGHEQ
jgi:hypothetical protein